MLQTKSVLPFLVNLEYIPVGYIEDFCLFLKYNTSLYKMSASYNKSINHGYRQSSL